MNLRDIAKKVGSYISSKTQDDEGFFRQGKFTPVKEINNRIAYQKQVSPINRAIYTGIGTAGRPVLNSLLNIGALEGTAIGALQSKFGNYEGAQKSFDKANRIRQYTGTQGSFDQGTGWNTIKKGGLDAVQTALTGKGLKLLTPSNLAMSGLIGGGASKIMGGDFATGFGQGMGATPQIMGFVGASNPLLAKFIPKSAGNIGGRIAGAGLNVAQGVGMDVARGMPTTAGSVGLDALMGLVGGKGQFDAPKIKIKGMSPQVFTSDKTILNEAKQQFKVGMEIEPFSKLGKDLKNMYKQYGLASYPGWNKLSMKQQVDILDDRLSEMARQWGDKVTMGIYGGKEAQGYKPNMEGQFSNMADKKVRFEIDDSSFKFKPVEGGYGNKTFKLGDLVEHKELFKNYPELKNVEVSFNGKGNASVFEQGNKGSFGGNKIEISNVNSTDEAKSTLLHEIQHAVQENENFAKGGSPNFYYENTRNRALSEIDELEFKKKTIPHRFVEEIQSVQNKIDELKNRYELTGQQKYERLSGEIEARDVQSRMDLTPEQRAKTQPYVSQGIPQNEWITKFDDNTSLSSPIKTGEVSTQQNKYQGFEKQVVDKYGLTNNPAEASFITSKGDFIKSSGGDMDSHLSMVGAVGTEGYLKDTNSIRFTQGDSAIYVQTASPITSSQKTALSDIVMSNPNKKIVVDWTPQAVDAYGRPMSKTGPQPKSGEFETLPEAIRFINQQSQISPEVKTGEIKQPTIKIKPNDDLVTKFDETIKIKPSEKVKVSSMSIEQPELKQRGFSASVQEAPDISKKTKIKVLGGYETKPNEQLMGEAKALLNEGVDLKNINKIENIDQKIAATIQEAINLDASGKHDEAAALFNNLSELGTQVGRGTQAFSLLNKMSPEAISLSVAGKIKKYNLSNVKKLPELTGDQQKSLSNQVREALKFPEGSRERGIAIGRVNETINSFIPSTIADKFITAWKAGLLSSLRTHERNIVGNVIMQTGEQASLYPASLADKLMSLKTGTRTLVPSQKGTIKGAIEGGQTAADVVRYGFDPMGTDIAKYEIKKVNWGNNPVEQALKKATDVVFNTLEAEDKVFWKSSYNRSLYNQAATEALNQGKRGDTKLIQQLFDNATEDMKKTAFNDANYSTFKDKNMLSGSIGQFKSWVNRQTGPAAEAGKVVSEMLMPFTGVPTSIVGKTIAYSPIGLVKGSINFGRVVSGSEVPGLQRQAAQEIGRGVIGSGIFGLGSYLMSQGLMTGQAKDEKERKQWELEGKQENSVLVNGKWRSINSVGPQTLVLLAGAKFNEMQNDPEQNLGTYGFSMAKDQLNQTFLSGVQQPLSALNEPYKAKSYLGGQVASLVPNIIKDVSKAFDPLAREVDTSTIGSSIKGRVQQSIPFVRNKMIPQRDVLGNEIAQTPTGIGAYVDLFNSKTPISNNVVNELSRLNDIGYNKTPTKLDKNQTIQGEKMVLNQAQLDRLEIVSGLATDKALNDLFNTTAYQSLNDAEKQDAIGDVITNTRKNVRAKINLKNIEEKSYTTSSDSQLAELGGFGMFTKAVTTNPKSAINALLTGNPIRKTSDGSIVVLERQNDIGSYDLGDTASQVDHSIPLSLGGTNEVRNLQILNNEEHAIKTKTDMYLLDKVKSGEMELKEAQEKAKNWRDTALSLPKDTQSQIIDEINSETAEKQSDGSQVYKIVSDTGNVTLVDLGTPIKEPEHTGFTEVDKKLKSSYKSAITKRINNIIKLYEDGQLSAKEAERYINELKTQSSATGTKSTKSKGGKITIKSAKYDIPKINIKFQSPTSTVKLKSAPKIKISKTDNRKYTIKA